MKSLHIAVATLFLCAWTGQALALDLGDQAPALKVEKWVKGDPVKLADGKGEKVYVVEFWATWCVPCRASIPHLTELQAKYKDKGVVFVGISVDEDKRRKTRDEVGPFVEKMGDKMKYVVALDTTDGATSNAYMEPFGLEGIPASFVIDKQGRLVWYGHPMSLDEPLEQILAGKYDLEAFKKEDAKRRAMAADRARTMELMRQYFQMVSAEEKGENADSVGTLLYLKIGKDADLLNMLSWEILTNPGIKHRDLELALRAGKAAYDACEGENAAIVDTYARALFDTGKIKEAVKYQRKAVELAKDNEEMLAELKETLDRYEAAASGA